MRKKLVDSDKVLDDQLIMDSIALASILPGPLAVNITAYLGFYLRGWAGALLSMSAVLLPSVLLMILLSEFHDSYSSIPAVERFLLGVLPVIAAIILSVAYKMSRKNIRNGWQWIILIAVLVLSFLIRGYFIFLIMLLIGGISGWYFGEEDGLPHENTRRSDKAWSVIMGVVIIVITCLFFASFFQLESILLFTFAKVSLTLFGGGYVMVPVLFDIVVEQNKWLTDLEFSKAIAFGQITPGPILVSATFVGYRVAGIVGAISATVGIFLPSAMLMIVVGVLYQSISQTIYIHKVLSGISPVIIAYITYSVVLIVPFSEIDWFVILTIITSLVVMIRFNLSFFWLLLCFGFTRAIFF